MLRTGAPSKSSLKAGITDDASHARRSALQKTCHLGHRENNQEVSPYIAVTRYASLNQMFARQLVDIVAFLQSRYVIRPLTPEPLL